MASLRRLAKDHANLRKALPPNYLFQQQDDCSGDDLSQLSVMVTGAAGTPYADGLWHLHLKMPVDYPKNPPKATFRTRIYHPNVDEKTGAVCLETLKRDWDPKLTLNDILITISCLLIQPNPDSALNAAAGALIQEDFDAFAQQARLMTKIHAPIPSSLREAVQDAKSRGEDLEATSAGQLASTSQHIEEDDTKENETGKSAPTSRARAPMQTDSRGKRPLSELPTADDSIQQVEPRRKSPKTTHGECQEVDVLDFHVRAPSSSTLALDPVAIRRVSKPAAGRNKPRVGIRRL